MTLPGAHHALALFCALLLALRSRTIPSLRPAAVAVAAFCALDAARLVGLPPMADVVAFVMMPACWVALLQPEAGTRPGDGRIELAAAASTPAHLTGAFPEFAPRPIIDASASGSTAGVGFSRSGMVRAGERLKAVRNVLKFGHVARILPRLAPFAFCLLFSLLLLLSRHHPAVAAHWQEALAVPRLVVGGVALWVALKSRGPRANPEPTVTFEPTLSTPGGVPVAPAPCSRNLGGGTSGRPQESYPLRLPPSTLIGIILSLGSAACVVGGLWAGDWGGVRAVSLVSWGLVVGVAWRAR